MTSIDASTLHSWRVLNLLTIKKESKGLTCIKLLREATTEKLDFQGESMKTEGYLKAAKKKHLLRNKSASIKRSIVSTAFTTSLKLLITRLDISTFDIEACH